MSNDKVTVYGRLDAAAWPSLLSIRLLASAITLVSLQTRIYGADSPLITGFYQGLCVSIEGGTTIPCVNNAQPSAQELSLEFNAPGLFSVRTNISSEFGTNTIKINATEDVETTYYAGCVRPNGRTYSGHSFYLSQASVVRISLSSNQSLPPWSNPGNDTVAALTWFGGLNHPNYLTGQLWNYPAGTSPSLEQYCYCIEESWSDQFTAFASPGAYYYGSSSSAGYATGPCLQNPFHIAGSGSVSMQGSVTFERCLQITRHPLGSVDSCNGGLVILSVSAKGATEAGSITYQWEWRPSDVGLWQPVLGGINSDGGISFNANSSQASWIILNFGAGQGTLPAGTHPEFRCVVSNDCTSETSEISRLSGCDECPPTLGTHPAKWKKAECINGEMVLVDPQTTFDCSKPTVPILHGWLSDAEADWIPCLVCEVDQRYAATGVNILVADSSYYMKPVEAATVSAVGGLAVGGFLGGPVGAALSSAGAAAVTGLFEAKSDIPRAAADLASDLKCLGSPCGSIPSIDLMIGHSFGGGIAAEVAGRIIGNTGQRIPTLLTIDTPYNVFGIVTMDNQSDQAAAYFDNHINYYSPCRTGVGFGTALPRGNGTNVRNFNAGAGDRVTSRCGLREWQHTCLADQVCGLLGSSDALAQALLAGQIPPGDYMEGLTPNTVVPGNEASNCEPIEVPNFDGATIVADDIEQSPSASQGTTFDGESVSLGSPNGYSSYVGWTVTLSDCPGFLIFEYQLVDLSPGQHADVVWNGGLLWSASISTPPGVWREAIVDVRGDCISTASLVYLLAAPPNGAPNPLAMFRIRNIHVVHRDVRACVNPPSIVQQPIPMVAAAGETVALGVGPDWPYGVAYRWERNGVPCVDGPTPTGGLMLGSLSPILGIHLFSSNEVGEYRCVITNSCGTTTSNTVTITLPGDTNRDRRLDGLDVQGFVATLIDGGLPSPYLEPSDLNRDGVVDSSDLEILIGILANQ